ncbi:MAG: Bax inhibitor-1/YccA family protein [Oligoflexales bacterium]|nr:Bax inhibitor-1/YccA family protein [Oligoflexales bacterium]
MRTSNPALKTDTFMDSARGVLRGDSSDVMTIDGSVNKTGILAFLLVCSAAFVWSLAYKTTGYGSAPAIMQNPGIVSPWMIGGALGGLVLAFATIFKPVWAPYTAPGYAILEGFFIGGISATMELRFPGIVMQASFLTMGTLVSMVMAYKAGLIKATAKFRSGMMMALGGIFFLYIMSFILSLFGVNMSFMHDSSPLSIGISLVVVVVASLSLILDFDLIETGARQRAPKHMEWYGAFALIVTLVWLYVEFLRLLSKINSRD